MLFHNADKLSEKCKSGFGLYAPELIDKAIDIVDNEDLDYLKLSFSEVYGTNA